MGSELVIIPTFGAFIPCFWRENELFNCHHTGRVIYPKRVSHALITAKYELLFIVKIQ